MARVGAETPSDEKGIIMGLDDIVDQAKDLAEDAADKAKELAGEVKDRAEHVIHGDDDDDDASAAPKSGGTGV